MKHEDYQAVIAAPFGALGVRAVNGVLHGIEFLSPGTRLREPPDAATQRLCAQLTAYLQDARASLDMPRAVAGTPHQRSVWQAMCEIPVGQTLTYAELAAQIGSGARAVANACGANPLPLVIPCHRVVAKNGLGGFMQGREASALSIKQWLLQHERNSTSATG